MSAITKNKTNGSKAKVEDDPWLPDEIALDNEDTVRLNMQKGDIDQKQAEMNEAQQRITKNNTEIQRMQQENQQLAVLFERAQGGKDALVKSANKELGTLKKKYGVPDEEGMVMSVDLSKAIITITRPDNE